MEKSHNKCIQCGGQFKELSNYSRNKLVRCTNCKFVFCKNIPSEQELINHYKQYTREDYLSDITIKRYNELLDVFSDYRVTNKILDVGCGVGYFLEIAKDRGWEVYGTEFTKEAVDICTSKGIIMNLGDLNISNYSLESFDIITSFEVIEHINNPNEELQKFHSLLRKNGLVYCTTPNFNSLLRYKFKENYNIISYPEHLSYYTPYTLRKVFKRNNFKPLKVTATGLSISRLKNSRVAMSGKGKIEKQIAKDSSDEILRNKMESNKLLHMSKHILNRILTILGVGDALKIFALKNH